MFINYTNFSLLQISPQPAFTILTGLWKWVKYRCTETEIGIGYFIIGIWDILSEQRKHQIMEWKKKLKKQFWSKSGLVSPSPQGVKSESGSMRVRVRQHASPSPHVRVRVRGVLSPSPRSASPRPKNLGLSPDSSPDSSESRWVQPIASLNSQPSNIMRHISTRVVLPVLLISIEDMYRRFSVEIHYGACVLNA